MGLSTAHLIKLLFRSLVWGVPVGSRRSQSFEARPNTTTKIGVVVFDGVLYAS